MDYLDREVFRLITERHLTEDPEDLITVLSTTAKETAEIMGRLSPDADASCSSTSEDRDRSLPQSMRTGGFKGPLSEVQRLVAEQQNAPTHRVTTPFRPNSRRLQQTTTPTTVTTVDPDVQYQAYLDYDPFADLRVFSRYTGRQLSSSFDELTFKDVSALETGFFRICFQHFSEIFDVGMVIVKPDCGPGMVAVDGTVCVTQCPAGTIPVFGRCKDADNFGYSDASHLVLATPSQLQPGPEGFPFIVPGSASHSSTDGAVDSVAQALAQKTVSTEVQVQPLFSSETRGGKARTTQQGAPP